MKQHAFLVLAHKQPLLLQRILKHLSNDNHYFFVHIDAKNTHFEEFKEALKNIPNLALLSNKYKVYHAGISIVDATLWVFNKIMCHSIDFDYIHLISGQDYPLRSNEQFDAFFETTNHSFTYRDQGAFKQQMEINYHRKANQYHFNCTNTLYSRIYEKLGLGNVLAMICKRTPINNLVGGWQWFSWNKKVATYVHHFLQENPTYLKRFNHTQSPDEIIFHSILYTKEKELEIEINNPLRYISWHPHRPIDTNYRPFDFTEEDYNYIINSKAFFCRKVDEVKSATLLNMIDAQRGDNYNIEEHKHYV